MMTLPSTLTALLAQAGGEDDNALFYPPGHSQFADSFDLAFDVIFWICTFFFVLIVAVMAVFLVLYRRRPGHVEQVTSHHNTTLEITWSVIPALLILAMFGAGGRRVHQRPAAPRQSVRGQRHRPAVGVGFRLRPGPGRRQRAAPPARPPDQADDVQRGRDPLLLRAGVPHEDGRRAGSVHVPLVRAEGPAGRRGAGRVPPLLHRVLRPRSQPDEPQGRRPPDAGELRGMARRRQQPLQGGRDARRGRRAALGQPGLQGLPLDHRPAHRRRRPLLEGHLGDHPADQRRPRRGQPRVPAGVDRVSAEEDPQGLRGREHAQLPGAVQAGGLLRHRRLHEEAFRAGLQAVARRGAAPRGGQEGEPRRDPRDGDRVPRHAGHGGADAGRAVTQGEQADGKDIPSQKPLPTTAPVNNSGGRGAITGDDPPVTSKDPTDITGNDKPSEDAPGPKPETKAPADAEPAADEKS